VSDRLAAALAETSYDFYVRSPDGTDLPQSSAPEVVERVLRFAEIFEGANVLEIGTGSGFSTALLSRLVGDDGRVVSLDIDPPLLSRAASLLRRDGRINVTIVVADGRDGYRSAAPYDRLVAWASVEGEVPTAWFAQVAPGSLVVTPLRRGDAQTVVKFVVGPDGVGRKLAETSGAFIPLTAKPFHPWERGTRD
jgi:protein-L-isoaspartate(D-aspartate) O-methyltransferase